MTGDHYLTHLTERAMALEVRELNIKVSVGNDTADNNAEPADGGSSSSPDQIRQIVEKVLEALDKRKER